MNDLSNYSKAAWTPWTDESIEFQEPAHAGMIINAKFAVEKEQPKSGQNIIILNREGCFCEAIITKIMEQHSHPIQYKTLNREGMNHWGSLNDIEWLYARSRWLNTEADRALNKMSHMPGLCSILNSVKERPEAGQKLYVSKENWEVKVTTLHPGYHHPVQVCGPTPLFGIISWCISEKEWAEGRQLWLNCQTKDETGSGLLAISNGAGCQHQYVNIGFNSIHMACKYCGVDQ